MLRFFFPSFSCLFLELLLPLSIFLPSFLPSFLLSCFGAVVGRLSHELELYQRKYSPLTERERAAAAATAAGARAEGEQVSPELLEPLLAAYDERLADKDARLQAMQQTFESLGGQLRAVVAENNELHAQVEALQAESPDDEDWADLREHVTLLAKENKLLLEQQQGAVLAADRYKQDLDAAQRALARNESQV